TSGSFAFPETASFLDPHRVGGPASCKSEQAENARTPPGSRSVPDRAPAETVFPPRPSLQTRPWPCPVPAASRACPAATRPRAATPGSRRESRLDSSGPLPTCEPPEQIRAPVAPLREIRVPPSRSLRNKTPPPQTQNARRADRPAEKARRESALPPRPGF